jgi:hypothetical protein
MDTNCAAVGAPLQPAAHAAITDTIARALASTLRMRYMLP